MVGRVHFNLAENRRNAASPCDFLATYTTRLSAQAKPSTSRSARRYESMRAQLTEAAQLLKA